MKLRSPWLIRLTAWLAAILIRLWLSTVRARAISVDGRPHPPDPAETRYIYAFWHDGLLAPLVTSSQARVLISKHADGELIAQVCGHLGIGVIRGSTTRGGVEALREMIRAAGEPAHLGITPDGPKGPRRELQPGLVMVASQTGLLVAPIGIGFSRAWRAPSWDRFAVPLPFSTMVGIVGEPIAIPPALSKLEMRRYQALVQARLSELTAAAEAWGTRIRKQGKQATPPAGAALAKFRRAA